MTSLEEDALNNIIDVSLIKKPVLFVDLGSHVGGSVTWALKRYKNNLYRIHAFEPLKENFSELEKLHGNNPLVTLHNKAAWLRDEIKQFYTQTWGARTGSSLIVGKSSTSLNVYVEMECFNLSEWILNNMDNSKYHTILKMDIEGAEFEVIPHIFIKNAEKFIDEWFIEWHLPKSPNSNQKTIDFFNEKINKWVNWGHMGAVIEKEIDPKIIAKYT